MDETTSELTERVVTAVTAKTGQDPLELPPLYEAIDPEALDTACETLDSGEVTFRYANHHITVRADRTVEATNRDERGSSRAKRAADD